MKGFRGRWKERPQINIWFLLSVQSVVGSSLDCVPIITNKMSHLVSGFKFRPAIKQDVQDLYISWAIDEGWNMPTVDPATYFDTYPQGWMVAENEDHGFPLGILYCTKYPSGIGHIGYIIVKKEVRGAGIGTAMIKHALEYLKAAKFIALYSGKDELPFYRNLGFQDQATVIRMTRKGQDSGNDEVQSATREDNGVTVRNFNKVRDLDQVLKMDEKLSGAHRPRFWALYGTDLPESSCQVAETVEGTVVGVGALRTFSRGQRLGPLYASDKDVSHRLAQRLLIDRKDVSIDVPTSNTEAGQMASSFGFVETDQSHLLVKGASNHPSFLADNVSRIWGICSLDFN